MKLIFHSIILIIFSFTLQISHSQTTLISGSISDNYGPLPGVEILLKNTSNGTQTDFDGNFSIEISLGSTLSFKHLGMLPVEKTISINT